MRSLFRLFLCGGMMSVFYYPGRMLCPTFAVCLGDVTSGIQYSSY
ncbi:hypothetical protein M125_3409 [Bacteroides fragilis str. 3998T(B)3]|uniref:Uncharacterized protein n=1 Tax=Bacteroides fragilis str. 3998T(B)3 TaxID=1339316 RepID=A0A015V3I7_BACFG|nr:hypothetical protein M125_3409 [Bacteroides fragilis str. 3998T(B)3]EXZ93703.1 hypothetical protein M065_3726 [Bacteroides fragilis str. Korea 419]